MEISEEERRVYRNRSIGKIVIYSPSISNGYLGEPHTHIISKQKLITNDLGYLDEDGKLHIIGRQGQSFHTAKGEIWFNQIAEKLYENKGLIKVMISKLPSGKIEIKYTPFRFDHDYEIQFLEILLQNFEFKQEDIVIHKERNLEITK